MLLVFDLIFFILQPVQASGENTLLIGLDADMSSGSAQAGVAIERGALISIEEINQKAQENLAEVRVKIAKDTEVVRISLQQEVDEFANAIGKKILGRTV